MKGDITSGPLWDRMAGPMVGLDGVVHVRLRRLVSQAFTLRAAERMRTACSAIITELIDRHIVAGRCHVVADIARPYPLPIICMLLGGPAKTGSCVPTACEE